MFRWLSKWWPKSSNSERIRRAHTWDLWAAAYIINGGCSDDGFDDFKAALLTMPDELFDQVVEDPDCLADLADDVDLTSLCDDSGYYEDEIEWPTDVELTVRRLEDSRPSTAVSGRPGDPAGTPWKEDSAELERRLPRLWAKFADPGRGDVRRTLIFFPDAVSRFSADGGNLDDMDHLRLSPTARSTLLAKLESDGFEIAAEHEGRAVFLRRLSTAEVRVTVLETEVELDLLGDDSMSEPPSTLLEAAFELLDPESLVLYDPETDEWPRKRAT